VLKFHTFYAEHPVRPTQILPHGCVLTGLLHSETKAVRCIEMSGPVSLTIQGHFPEGLNVRRKYGLNFAWLGSLTPLFGATCCRRWMCRRNVGNHTVSFNVRLYLRLCRDATMMSAMLWWDNLTGRDYLEKLCVVEKIILNCIFNI
jgi:hypothetical protein